MVNGKTIFLSGDRKMNKKDKQALEEVTTDLTPDVEERAKKKKRKLKLQSILRT